MEFSQRNYDGDSKALIYDGKWAVLQLKADIDDLTQEQVPAYVDLEENLVVYGQDISADIFRHVDQYVESEFGEDFERRLSSGDLGEQVEDLLRDEVEFGEFSSDNLDEPGTETTHSNF